ncbi:MAG: hypothetical protein A2315_10065 [Ignavibacteria bacterium RIFOXYB2_FULL_35_12]|nr:MAG: hypothetical protein A2058_15240 [Ignavibacteria bacterium GWA2_36_19]OGU51093.1 MAG: hypothetical protein A2006_01955 [Ignavibacteria bacterium GWC2_35_8]OGU57092.1 MAG: hypothetical protein A2X60_12500 [Ignavibacteria bacterium GWF2_35_20]OGU81677.1 MAG: hypothetical protein A2254_06590 [Ignavibacteria bacterium RIFOXYA2_FULL_35_9]OGU88852.1 MAG: hypothetical protein A3K31_01690 [Ignavibacteria bacterium RIFOXYA12_FULL_35_25]OGU90650.1 MAG: hypothetical protein A2492_09365 [Ignavibac
MDLIKQYIVQSITTASGNLRLNNQRIEVLAMLKEVILKSKNIQQDLNQMKKITELSKIAIKLSEIHHYLSEGSIDFLKATDNFKAHSYNLIKEINHMLDMVNPYTFRHTIDRLIEPERKIVEIIIEPESKLENELETEFLSRKLDNLGNSISAVEKAKEMILLEEEKDKDDLHPFNSFESTILKPIKSIDSILNEINIDSEIPAEVEEYSKVMAANADLSLQNGFDILSQMHTIISEGLIHLKNKSLVPSKEVTESIRACLIVIVAVVKSKEIDIKNYLNRAEVFGKFLQKIKTEEHK